MLKKIVIVVVVLLLLLVGVASTKPDSFAVERSTVIKAPPEKVFALINDFHSWEQWSPWAKLDTAMKVTYSGAPTGPGAVYEWVGNSQVGEGRMEITDATAPSKVGIKLDFLKPIEGHNVTVFSITPEGDGSKVVWDMKGPNPFISKVMAVFVSMDSMIGGDFEKGLANLKTAAEK